MDFQTSFPLPRALRRALHGEHGLGLCLPDSLLLLLQAWVAAPHLCQRLRGLHLLPALSGHLRSSALMVGTQIRQQAILLLHFYRG